MVVTQGISSISHCVDTGVGGFGSRGGEDEVDLVVDDQLLSDFSRAVGTGLAVLDDNLRRIVRVADLDPAFHGVLEVRDDEIVCFGEGG
jgi:hypothetical protein